MSKRIDLPPYTRGWFAVAASSELDPGDVRACHYFGQELVLYRTEGGHAALLDAHCPHLGAHLGHGGEIRHEDIVCPFHGWRFGKDGICSGMPYGARKTPAETRSWPIREHSGVIMTWFCPGGSSPDWEMPEFDPERWTEPRTEKWEINGHTQEIAENAADFAHFCFVHKTFGMRAYSESPIIEGPSLRYHIESDINYLNEGEIPDTPELEGLSAVFGPGLVYAQINARGAPYTGLQRLYSTPIDEERLHVLGLVSVEKGAPDEETEAILEVMTEMVMQQWTEDFKIWEHKLYRPTPLLNDRERPIADFRRFYKQFYVSP